MKHSSDAVLSPSQIVSRCCFYSTPMGTGSCPRKKTRPRSFSSPCVFVCTVSTPSNFLVYLSVNIICTIIIHNRHRATFSMFLNFPLGPNIQQEGSKNFLTETFGPCGLFVQHHREKPEGPSHICSHAFVPVKERLVLR